MSEIKHITIATHDGKFHADEVVAVAIVQYLHKAMGHNVSIVRTRDPAIYNAASFRIDIGGVDDRLAGSFDHHQRQGAGFRQLDGLTEVPYASAGLVWRDFGVRFLETLLVSKKILAFKQTIDVVWEAVDRDFICPIDANDCGVNFRQSPIPQVVGEMNPSWIETKDLSEDEETNLRLQRFFDAVRFGEEALINHVMQQVSQYEAKRKTASVISSNDPILFFPEPVPWHNAILESPNDTAKLVIIRRNDRRYDIQTIPTAKQGFANRMPLPAAWGGLNGESLDQVTGIKGGIFCHRALFIAAATSLEAAYAMAQLAIDLHERYSTTSKIEASTEPTSPPIKINLQIGEGPDNDYEITVTPLR